MSYCVLSYGLSPHIPFGNVSKSQLLFNGNLGKSIKSLPNGIVNFLEGRNFMEKPALWLITYTFPLLVSSVIFLIILVLLSKKRDEIEPEIPNQLLKWAIIFSLIVVLAIPVLVDDFWLPIAWGRMISQGINPYYELPSEFPAIVNDLPLVGEKMTYGPLWALLNGIVMGLVRNHLWMGAIFMKLLLVLAWIGSLKLIRNLLRDHPLWHQSVGILIFGWLPIGIIQSIADGHNDVVLLFFVLLWLYGLNENLSLLPRLSLIASILIKYVTAPLILLDFLHEYFKKRRNLGKYFFYLGISAIIGFAVFRLFFRSMEMFNYLTLASRMHYYSPADAFRSLLTFLELDIPGASLLARVIFASIFIAYLLKYLRKRDNHSLWLCSLALMTFILFAINRHVWPWYIVWVLGLAALTSGSLLARWIIGVSLLLPFPILIWVVFPQADQFIKFALPALLLYGASLIWLAFIPSRWFPTFQAEPLV